MEDHKMSDALRYHSEGRPGKIEVIPTKPTQTKRDLSLAYSPGVAEPCLEIAKSPEDVYKYTAKGNLVAVITNGSAVLGLGDLGPAASKPVMEGKGLLFKIFADIDVFDIELDCKTVDEFVAVVKALEPTFGGINLEDIKAPESFEIETRLKAELKIPIMHDDQHGTAIISGAALLNALRVVKKEIGMVNMVINGAGASAVACGKLFVELGIKRENLIMLDSKGVITTKRTDLDQHKGFFAREVEIESLEEAMKGADIFIGLSKGNIVSQNMIRSMAKDPIVFAMANPDPEIEYDLAMASRPDVIVATGRSDHPNQVNNVLGFPFIFRGALDVRATTINEAMKLAAVHAIADLALEPVPEEVNLAYGEQGIIFGREYIIPKPIDPRLILKVAPAVARAAIASGVAKNPVINWDEYDSQLRKRLGLDNKFVRRISVQAKQNPQRVVFAEADKYKILKAAQIVYEEGTAIPVLLGKREVILSLIEENNIQLPGVEIIDLHQESERLEKYAEILFDKRKRRGLTLYDAKKIMKDRNYFGTMMVETGEADAFISGLTRNYPNTVKPALQIIGRRPNLNRVAGMYIIMTKQGPMFFADTTINIDPSWEDLVEITRLSHEQVKRLHVEPRIAMLSYTNFGSAPGEIPEKVQKAVQFLHKFYSEIMVDGDVQANFALDADLRYENFPFCKLGNSPANTFIFPNLAAGNISYKFAQMMGGTEVIGPILMGFRKSVHILQLGSSVREIVNMINIAVVDAQSKKMLL
jgi:malate dehydrogenase (oxaloacetate-decarboxylating)(NADP+)